MMISLQTKLSSYRDQNLLRKRKVVSQTDHNHIVIDGQAAISFCSNDYLGLSHSEKVKKAFIEGVEEYGFGGGASALISGYYGIQKELEEKFAQFLGRDRAIYFNSGYCANTGIIPALLGRHDAIAADVLCHASMIDGIRLSRAKYFRYQHNDIESLENLLTQNSDIKAIITESVFSMGGNIAALDKISNLAKQHSAMLILDDAHGVGVLGKTGQGLIEHYGLTSDAVDCLVTPLGKAFGAIGAVVSGSGELIEAILQFSRTYHYTTALPPALAKATLQSLQVLQEENWRREKLKDLIIYFITQAKSRGLSLLYNDITPIKSFLLSDNVSALRIQAELLEKGFYVSCIRPPTVPISGTQIRVSLNCFHETRQIDQLLDALREVYGN
jgi:8-amino-7-oxononanoate synthase